MTRFGLFAVPLVFVAGFMPGSVQAQQVPNGPLGATPADTAPAGAPGSSAQPKVSARDRAELNALIDKLRAVPVEIESVEPVKNSLEQFFLKVVTGEDK